MRSFSLGLFVVVCIGCSSSSGSNGGTGGGVSNGGGSATGGGSTGTGGGGTTDGGGIDAGTLFSMNVTVPADGGSITVMGSQQFTIVFPADVAGQSFTVELIPATTYGFAPGYFSDLFRFGPSGTQLTTPVRIIPVNPTPPVGFGFLYSDPVVPQGAEVSWFVPDGGYYPVPHFSSFGIPAPMSKMLICSTESQAEAGENFCQTFGYSTLNHGYAYEGNAIATPGYATVQDTCAVGNDNCMFYITGNCLSVGAIGAFNNDPHNVWIPAGQLPTGFEEVAIPTFGKACPYITVPSSCSNMTGDIEPVGCHFGASCNAKMISLSCDGTTCTCSGGLDGGSAASLPQGSTCANLIKGAETLFAQCQ